jgi:hypothetical protein
MPHEVFMVSGPSRQITPNQRGDLILNKSPEEVREEIARVLDDIAERGGRLLMAETVQAVLVRGENNRGPHEAGRGYFYFAAEFPEEPTS